MIGVQVWNLDSPRCKYTLTGHLNVVNSLDFFTRHGQQYLITGSSDETAKVCYFTENILLQSACNVSDNA
jgi:WD40 repeat protein